LQVKPTKSIAPRPPAIGKHQYGGSDGRQIGRENDFFPILQARDTATKLRQTFLSDQLLKTDNDLAFDENAHVHVFSIYTNFFHSVTFIIVVLFPFHIHKIMVNESMRG
jgi:hypothetical protein